MFWRTTVKEKQLPISKHNNQAKFPRGQLMCQLSKCYLGKTLAHYEVWEANCHLEELYSPQREGQVL